MLLNSLSANASWPSRKASPLGCASSDAASVSLSRASRPLPTATDSRPSDQGERVNLVRAGVGDVERVGAVPRHIPRAAQPDLQRVADGAVLDAVTLIVLRPDAGDRGHGPRSQIDRAHGVILGVGHVQTSPDQRHALRLVEGRGVERDHR